MDQLRRSCQGSQQYPLNLVASQDATYDLSIKQDLLGKISTRTFADEAKAKLDLWEYKHDAYHHTLINSRQALRDHLNLANQCSGEVSLCRFAFIQASSSRTKLLLTRDMLTDLLSYFQVMACIVSMLASFGCDADKDFQHCQFEADIRLAPDNYSLSVPELNRSGRILELAYVFRTVEASSSVPGMPWQIKQTCVQHSFDVETGLTTWMIIQGSDSVKKRIMNWVEPSTVGRQHVADSCASAFLSSLRTQLMFCDLSVENWRSYINFLEQEVQKLTRAITFKPVDVPKTVIPMQKSTSGDSSSPLSFRAQARTFTYNQLSRSNTFKSWMSRMDIPDSSLQSKAVTEPRTNLQSTQDLAVSVDENQTEEVEYFKTLKNMEGLEERAYEALLVLKTTVRIWNQLQRAYVELVSDEHFPEALKDHSRRGLKRFCSRLENIKDTLENQILRVETLATMLSGRKTLVTPIRRTTAIRADCYLAA